MKLILALTALIVVAQAQPYYGHSNWGEEENRFFWLLPDIGEEENKMGPDMAALMIAATKKFCKDVANGKDKAAWAHANQALAFQCGPLGTQAGCDEMTADKKLVWLLSQESLVVMKKTDRTTGMPVCMSTLVKF